MINTDGYTVKYGHDVVQGGHYLEVYASDGTLVDAYHTHPRHDDYSYTLARADKLADVMLHYNVPPAWVKNMKKREGVK